MTLKKPVKKIRRAPRGRDVFDELLELETEKTNPASANLHRLSTTGILRLMNQQDSTIPQAIAKEIRYIAKAVDMVIERLRRKDRIFYIGAGTSGRLGILDASECPPTFGTDPKLIQGIIAGGRDSLILSREGAEDNTDAAVDDINKFGVKKGDLVIGLTASKRTPYVLEGMREAKKRGAATIFITCNPRKQVSREFDLAICPVVGPEIIAGSSRMKAGTAQKMILNMISTGAMVKSGKVFGNRMVDLKATSEKLKERSKGVIMETCGIDYEDAEKLLKQSGGSVKTAIIMAKTGLSKKDSEIRLKKVDGFIHRALKKAAK
ncbi:MAG: N-acetylmuramic acid 6-phosphate etherase [candidate division Zixibacteria bacterium]